jgi:hypothetical protein
MSGPIRFVAAVLGGLAAGAGVSLAEGYSDAQMALAGRIGAAVALSRICNGTVPTSAVIATLQANGLTENDVLGDTPLRRRMQSGATAVVAASRAEQDGGRPQAEIVKSACEGFRASFGPHGLVLPEADARSCAGC